MTGTDNGTFHNFPFREWLVSRLCGRLDRMTGLFCCSENTSLHSRPCNFLAAIGPTTDITELYPVVAGLRLDPTRTSVCPTYTAALNSVRFPRRRLRRQAFYVTKIGFCPARLLV